VAGSRWPWSWEFFATNLAAAVFYSLLVGACPFCAVAATATQQMSPAAMMPIITARAVVASGGSKAIVSDTYQRKMMWSFPGRALY
jgi:hypothetical protein